MFTSLPPRTRKFAALFRDCFHGGGNKLFKEGLLVHYVDFDHNISARLGLRVQDLDCHSTDYNASGMAIATAWCVFITHPPQEVYNQFAACWPASLAPPPSSVMNLRRLTRSPRRRARAASRDRQPERLGRGQIDDEIEFGRLLDRDVARLRATQNFIDITSSAPEKVQKVRSI